MWPVTNGTHWLAIDRGPSISEASPQTSVHSPLHPLPMHGTHPILGPTPHVLASPPSNRGWHVNIFCRGHLRSFGCRMRAQITNHDLDVKNRKKARKNKSP